MMKVVFPTKFLSVGVCACLAPFVLTGCESARVHGGDPMPAMSFAHVQPYRLEVSHINLPAAYVESYEKSPAVQDFTISIPEAVHNYFARKFVASGEGGPLTIELQDISMTRELKESDSSMMAFLQMGASYRYELQLAVKIMMRREDGSIVSGREMNFDKTFFIPADDSIAKREAKQLDVVEQLIRDLDHNIQFFLDDVGMLASPEMRR